MQATVRHTDTETVKRAVGTTLLHEIVVACKIVVARKGMKTRICREVREPAASAFPGFLGRK